MNTVDDGKKIEYCCPRCLASTFGLDTDRAPRCARCLIRMLADTDEPIVRPQSGRKKPAPRQPELAARPPGGRPRSSSGKRLGAA